MGSTGLPPPLVVVSRRTRRGAPDGRRQRSRPSRLGLRQNRSRSEVSRPEPHSSPKPPGTRSP
ncbi:hypothetical protein Rumeso_03043 [Rubellimicrobium mesophilum DSM 19309]|uniref:Uncharacterized protein n=1 Tax=Rubellimicrobium mesophilum DSM 19309 TaxID=442562 RepID=A0A017HM14_9RHOB|nr:hypothetical protein Rumeso_03043 [Rubellimicrobium mesophilum DSM 19309]